MVYLVVPCYNEVRRLNVAEFRKFAGGDIHFVFVDDGSSDGTLEFLKSNFQGPSFTVVAQNPNAGKAQAVRSGFLHVLKNLSPKASDWIGFWDADLATPISEVENFLAFAKISPQDVGSIWGSRVYRLGAKIIRSPLRHYLGRVFATVIANALRIDSYDTQCGAKLFTPAVARKAFAEPFISRWIFDVEILMRIGQENVIEYPLMRWEDIPGSKVKVARESLRVLKEIWEIRKKYLKRS